MTKENNLTGPDLVEYCQSLMIDLGEEGVDELCSVVWKAAMHEAKTACTGVYTSNGDYIGGAYRRAIDEIPDPFEKEEGALS